MLYNKEAVKENLMTNNPPEYPDGTQAKTNEYIRKRLHEVANHSTRLEGEMIQDRIRNESHKDKTETAINDLKDWRKETIKRLETHERAQSDTNTNVLNISNQFAAQITNLELKVNTKLNDMERTILDRISQQQANHSDKGQKTMQWAFGITITLLVAIFGTLISVVLGG